MEKEEIARIVSIALSAYERLKNACDAALKAGAMDPDGPLWSAIWESYEKMLDALDVDGWICWFIYDNDCGRNAMCAAGVGGEDPRPIRDVYDLIDLIESSLK